MSYFMGLPAHQFYLHLCLVGQCQRGHNYLTCSDHVQVMVWWHQATSHYASHCWPRSLSHMASLGHKGLINGMIKRQQFEDKNLYLFDNKTYTLHIYTYSTTSANKYKHHTTRTHYNNNKIVFWPCQINQWKTFTKITVMTFDCHGMINFHTWSIEHSTKTMPRLCVLMVWFLAVPSHLQAWFWLLTVLNVVCCCVYRGHSSTNRPL